MPPAAASRIAFAPVVTGSSWRNAWQAMFLSAIARRGKALAADGSTVPRITNGDAVALVMAWAEAATMRRWPLWYQFAAAAYGWTATRDTLDTSAARRDARMPVQLAAELWLSSFVLAGALDDEALSSPRLALDASFDDVAVHGLVRAALVEDGARATLTAPRSPVEVVRVPRAPSADSLVPLALMLGVAWLLLSTPRRGRSGNLTG